MKAMKKPNNFLNDAEQNKNLVICWFTASLFLPHAEKVKIAIFAKNKK